MSTISYEDQMRDETIIELSNGLLRLTADMMELHGPDPSNHAIVAAAFKMALCKIGTIYPEVPLTVSIMVKEDAESKR